MTNITKIGYLKQHKNILLIVQGENKDSIWFHGLNDVYHKSDFTEMKPHPVFYGHGSTISEGKIIEIFKHTESLE